MAKGPMEVAVDALINVLRDHSDMRDIHFFFGDPRLYAHPELPLVAVAPANDSAEVFTTHKDRYQLSIRLFVVVNARADYGQALPESVGDRDLLHIIDGTSDKEGVRSILRGNITLDGSVRNLTVDNVTYRSGVMREEAVRIAEAIISAEVVRTR